MGMEDFQFLLGDLAVAFREDTLWRDTIVPGRFRIDAFEVPLGGIDPGLGVVQTWFYCDRAIVPKPWPELGDHLVIRGQVWEIVQREEDDIGELGFRLIKQELGISTVTSEGTASAAERRMPGRPSRRDEIAAAFADLDPERPLPELVQAVRAKLGIGRGLSDKTLRKILAEQVRARRRVGLR
jgi:hypothetical protein